MRLQGLVGRQLLFFETVEQSDVTVPNSRTGAIAGIGGFAVLHRRRRHCLKACGNQPNLVQWRCNN
jgi:hypothetical protein